MESEWREATRYTTENQGGQRVLVIEWQEFLIFHGVTGATKEYERSRRWTLANGDAVNYVDENTFQIFQTDEVLTKI